MIQLYFLSILINGLAGFLFALGDTGEGDSSIEGSLKFSLFGSTFRFVLGIVAVITGILKLLLPMGELPFLGDLVPALGSIVAGFILVFGFYREHASSPAAESEGKLDRVGEAFLRYKKLIGFILLASALLHFIFPQALFL